LHPKDAIVCCSSSFPLSIWIKRTCWCVPSSARPFGPLPLKGAHMLCFKSRGLHRGHRTKSDSVSVPSDSPTRCRHCGRRVWPAPQIWKRDHGEAGTASQKIRRAACDPASYGMCDRSPRLRLRKASSGQEVPTTAVRPAKTKGHPTDKPSRKSRVGKPARATTAAG